MLNTGFNQIDVSNRAASVPQVSNEFGKMIGKRPLCMFLKRIGQARFAEFRFTNQIVQLLLGCGLVLEERNFPADIVSITISTRPNF